MHARIGEFEMLPARLVMWFIN